MRRHLRVGVGQQDRELVTTEPGDGIRAAQTLTQQVGDVDDQLVARLVAERVIDGLEMVEVEDEQSAARSP